MPMPALLNTYVVGQQSRIGNPAALATSQPFKTAAGVATDPTVVLLAVRRPDNTTTVYAWPTPVGQQLPLLRESVGRFYVDVTIDQSGTWSYWLGGTGALIAAGEGQFWVEPRLA